MSWHFTSAEPQLTYSLTSFPYKYKFQSNTTIYYTKYSYGNMFQLY